MSVHLYWDFSSDEIANCQWDVSKPDIWIRKNKYKVDASTFGTKLCEMNISDIMVNILRLKLSISGVPIDGLANIYCDNYTVYKNTVIPESTLKKKHHLMDFH